MLATLDRAVIGTQEAGDAPGIDWRVMNDQAPAETDARTQFEEQALPFMDLSLIHI